MPRPDPTIKYAASGRAAWQTPRTKPVALIPASVGGAKGSLTGVNDSAAPHPIKLLRRRVPPPALPGQTVELSAAIFVFHALKSDVPIVIDFWAEWCGPCRMMTPNFEMAVPRLEPRVRLGKLDSEAEPAIAQRYSIRSIPSMVMIRKGREFARQEPAIVDWVEQALQTA